MCPSTGISYQEAEPNLFSFNSPYGACEHCNGLGDVTEADVTKIIPDTSKSIKKGGIIPIGEYKKTWIFEKLQTILNREDLSLDSPIEKIPNDILQIILYGNEGIEYQKKYQKITFEGIINFITRHSDEGNASIQRWAQTFMNKVICPSCNGARLKKESLYFILDNKNIGDLAKMDIEELYTWTTLLPENLQLLSKIILQIQF